MNTINQNAATATKAENSSTSAHRVAFTVVRQDLRGVDTIIIVRARVASEDLTGERAFLEAVKRAVTQWVKTTANGKSVWEGSCQDLNIGDMIDSGDDDLTGFLSDEGITEFEPESINASGCTNWVVDTVLVNTGDLPDFEDDDDE